MSNHKLETARAEYERWLATRRATEAFADDLVWDFSQFEGWVEDDVYFGPAGFDEQYARWTEPFDDYDIELTELIDLGGDDVLALGVQRGRLRGSGVAVQMDLAQIWTWRDDKLTRIRIFASQDDARAAAGVSE